MDQVEIIKKIRDILRENAQLDMDTQALADDSNLYEAGMSSSSNVNVLFALEQEFGIVFPEHLLERSTFENISSIHAAVLQVLNA